jgi:hypothetical protein
VANDAQGFYPGSEEPLGPSPPDNRNAHITVKSLSTQNAPGWM